MHDHAQIELLHDVFSVALVPQMAPEKLQECVMNLRQSSQRRRVKLRKRRACFMLGHRKYLPSDGMEAYPEVVRFSADCDTKARPIRINLDDLSLAPFWNEGRLGRPGRPRSRAKPLRRMMDGDSGSDRPEDRN